MSQNNSRQANKFALSTVGRHMGKEKSKSTEFLDKCQSFHLDTCTVVSARAHSSWDLSSGETCDIGKPTKLNKNMLSRTKSSTSTKRSKVIPFSVKYAVSLTEKMVDGNGNEEIEAKSSSSKLSGTDVLDQTLNCIRAKLNTLQSERVEMENKMTHIMEDIRSALTQAHYASISKGHKVYAKTKSCESSMHKQESSSSKIFFPVHNTDQPSITANSELYPTASPTSFFNRGGSMRQKITSVMLSPTQFIRQATTSSKSSTQPPTYSANSVCKTKKTFRNPMPECTIISTIPEDCIEVTNRYIAQHKPEEISISSRNTVVRRSSLTGQLEQLPTQSKEDSNVKMRDRSDKVHAIERSRKATSMYTHNIITASQHTSKYSVNAILLPSTETTV